MSIKLESFRSHLLEEQKTLYELLPLDTPLSILIDPCNLCNFKCKFCPTGDSELLRSVDRPKGMMSLNLFCKIIDDMKEFGGKTKRIHLYKDGEPFLNKSLTRMIAYAKENNVAEFVETTTNGSLINETIAEEVINAGLDVIRVSIEHISNNGYKDITQTFSNYELIRKNVEFLFKFKKKKKSNLWIHTKILDVGLSKEEKEKFIQDFSKISDSYNIDTLMGWSNSAKKDFTLGYSSSINKDMESLVPLKKDRKVCPEPFKTMSVNFNGLVSVCCVDWSFGTIIGDVNKESLVDIWNGQRLYYFRMLHLQNKRKEIEACSNCHYLQGLQPLSDLDDYSEKIMKLYSC